MNQKKIGKFIAECRKSKKMTQEELALKLGVTNRSVSRWENGKNMPDYSILKELCNILCIDVNEFLSGEKIEKDNIQMQSIDNLDLVLKEYYLMKKKKEKFKAMVIIGGAMLLPILGVLTTIFFLTYGFDNRLEITTNWSKYQNVIGSKAKDKYSDKWGMNEEIFPKSIKNLDVREFKMICDDFIDKQFLSYLVVDYDSEAYDKEINRLKQYGIEEYTSYYGVSGFSDYELVAMNSDDYYGFVYAITDGESRIIYVEMIFCNYTMDIDYENEILMEYLPDGIDLKEDNLYRKKMLKS